MTSATTRPTRNAPRRRVAHDVERGGTWAERHVAGPFRLEPCAPHSRRRPLHRRLPHGLASANGRSSAFSHRPRRSGEPDRRGLRRCSARAGKAGQALGQVKSRRIVRVESKASRHDACVAGTVAAKRSLRCSGSDDRLLRRGRTCRGCRSCGDSKFPTGEHRSVREGVRHEFALETDKAFTGSDPEDLRNLSGAADLLNPMRTTLQQRLKALPATRVLPRLPRAPAW